jgi:hypothetical protein
MLKRIIIYLIITFSLLLSVTFAQQNLDDIENDIKAELETKYVRVYRIGALEGVDEKINTYRDFKFPITDPYNTLSQCYIFQADVEAGALFGIYKSGVILWDSGPIIEFGEYADILGSMDLNNDGNVEVIYGMYYGMHNSSQDIWIISWDGQAGSILNDYYLAYNLYRSIIFSYDWFTEICDVNGDGILEIVGQDEETRVTKVYSWNGVKYGYYGLEMPQYLPMNLLTAKVKCKVTPSQNGLNFSYSISNDSTSRQPIWRFAVEKMFYLVYNFDAPYKWQGSYFYDWDNLLKWGIIRDSRFYPYNLITPGNFLDSMSFVSDSVLPFITTYYLQGKNGESFPDDQFIFENSFKGVTICGTNPPDPFVPINFIDSLINYNFRSFELGWITNQSTANKYDSLFTSAKTQLQQNNNNAARTTLQTVLQEVDIDSTNNLTSEAYALIKYNTEYLLSKLSEQSVLDISLINPAMSLVNPGAFTMEVKGGGFTANSTVYFNGNSRTTTFISDSVLNAQILSTDVSAAGNYPVWVNDGTTNSDTLVYKVVSTLPQPVRPVLECVRNNGDGTYTAFFGYKNDNNVSVYIPVGNKNKFTPTPQDRGQPRVFESGRHYKVFTVNFNGSNLVWTLNGRTSTASSNSAPCN